ncbi:hypothetical protein [Nitratireductor mangrovi]|uniref:hypothetical protein n=1 Tax=Nitratireductor mangrovi TaxID=2599600 RepID=UPI001981F639|nr:hypothetical protein [Nitratireductor mangrovi]
MPSGTEAQANLTNGATLLAFASVPVAMWIAHPDSAVPMGVGALAWVFALVLKVVVNRTPQAERLSRRGPGGAALAGLVSGVSELGVLWLAVAAGMAEATLQSGLWCGIGAAAVEVAYLVITGVRRRHDPELRRQHRVWLRGAAASRVVAHMFAIERALATLIHVASRVLVMASISLGVVWPVLLALLAFTAVDGTATYGAVHRWNWCRPTTARRFYLLLALCAVAVCIAAGWLAVRPVG